MGRQNGGTLARWLRNGLIGAAIPGVLSLQATRLVGQSSSSGQSSSRDVEWRVYWGDNRSSKYSPLDQINKDNVRDLRIAWRWKTINLGPKADFNWEATPIMVGGVLYVTAGYRLVALDAKTGYPIPSFGSDGLVDLWEDLDKPAKEGYLGLTAPPIVVGNTVVVGAAL
jgi:glucose dehydrogenase